MALGVTWVLVFVVFCFVFCCIRVVPRCLSPLPVASGRDEHAPGARTPAAAGPCVCVCVHAHVLCCVGEHGWVIAFSHVLVCCCGRLRRLVNDWHDDR